MHRDYEAMVAEAAREARKALAKRTDIATLRFPMADVACDVARRWCRRHKYKLADCPEDRSWLAAAVAQSLACDPIAHEIVACGLMIREVSR